MQPHFLPRELAPSFVDLARPEAAFAAAACVRPQTSHVQLRGVGCSHPWHPPRSGSQSRGH
eukprot:15125371-Alexandrium_andersonii.AAC.1